MPITFYEDDDEPDAMDVAKEQEIERDTVNLSSAQIRFLNQLEPHAVNVIIEMRLTPHCPECLSDDVSVMIDHLDCRECGHCGSGLLLYPLLPSSALPYTQEEISRLSEVYYEFADVYWE